MTASRRRFADIEEGEVFYRTAWPEAPTSANPLVMFHASPGSTRGLERLIVALGRTRKVVAFDTLGQGDSCGPARPDVDMTYYADAFCRALAGMGPEFAKVDLFGTHTGARIAIELAIAAPERVGKLIVDGMRRGPTDFWREYADNVGLAQYIDQNGLQFTKAWTRLRDQYLWFPPYARDAAHNRAVGLPDAQEMHDHAMDVFKGIRAGHIPYRLAVLYPSEQRLPRVRVPTLSTCAPGDTPIEDINIVASLIPGAIAKPHPQHAKVANATDDEIAALAAMWAEWLDA
jgi:pimeloyl-ACP methyl ester carboxylesterase